MISAVIGVFSAFGLLAVLSLCKAAARGDESLKSNVLKHRSSRVETPRCGAAPQTPWR